MINERIKKLRPYKVSELEEGEIKLDAQENPYALPQEVQGAIKETLSGLELNRYPDPSYRELKNLISAYCGLKGENILVGNGSDELILSILLASAGEGKRVAAPSPTFSMYGILASLTGSRYLEAGLGPDFTLARARLLSLRADVTFIAYPNNPTANCFNSGTIEKIISSSKGIVVIDEAYYEFSGKTFALKVNDYENLVVLRTFSKAFALAGIRAGYMLCNEKLASQFRKVQLPYNLSALNEEILKIVLSRRREILAPVEILTRSREKMQQKLEKMAGVHVFPSDANFIMMKIKEMDKVVESLKKNRIRVRKFSEPGLKNYLRVSVGSEKENRKFLRAMEEAL